MVDAKPSRGFDPAAHLEKQGWKGKGTALKSGHISRPLAVVQKKTLSGVGRDRNEAVPFWDHIFASTAASLSLPSSQSPTPAISSPSSPAPSATYQLADPRLIKSSSWQTGGSIPKSTQQENADAGPSRLPGLTVAVRIGRESAKRGLYSKFLRGEVISHEPTPEPDESEVKGDSEIAVGGLGVGAQKEEKTKKQDKKSKRDKSEEEQGRTKSKKKRREVTDESQQSQLEVVERKETKEEKRIRRELKAKRKAAKHGNSTLG